MSHFQPQEGNNEYYIEPRASGHICMIMMDWRFKRACDRVDHDASPPHSFYCASNWLPSVQLLESTSGSRRCSIQYNVAHQLNLMLLIPHIPNAKTIWSRVFYLYHWRIKQLYHVYRPGHHFPQPIGYLWNYGLASNFNVGSSFSGRRGSIWIYLNSVETDVHIYRRYNQAQKMRKDNNTSYDNKQRNGVGWVGGALLVTAGRH